MIWRSLSDKSGLDLQQIIDAVYKFDTDSSNNANRQPLVEYLTRNFDQYVKSNERPEDTLIDYDYLLGIKKKFNHSEFENADKLRKRGHNKNGEMEELNDSIKYQDDDDNEDNYEQQSKVKRFINSIFHASKIMCITSGKHYGNYLLALFIFTKILYTINSITQLFILNHFLVSFLLCYFINLI
jgi:hypothetical protein